MPDLNHSSNGGLYTPGLLLDVITQIGLPRGLNPRSRLTPKGIVQRLRSQQDEGDTGNEGKGHPDEDGALAKSLSFGSA